MSLRVTNPEREGGGTNVGGIGGQISNGESV